MKKASTNFSFLLFPLCMLPSLLAHAHHPNGYQLPNSFFEGLLSGFGHPVIGVDHLAFIIVMGILSYQIKQIRLIPMAFIVSAIIGTVLHLNAVNIAGYEVLVALSVLLLGFIVMLNINLKNKIAWLTAFSIAGILHGYAYGESVIGSEATVLSAYLLGFSVIQLAVCYLAVFLYQHLQQYFSQPKLGIFASNLYRFFGGGAVLAAVYILAT